jgi:hypothetical protein
MTRRVQFAPIVTAVPANPLCCEAWYSHAELRGFKEQARQIMHSFSSTSSLPSAAFPAGERGFEYLSSQRRQHRVMAIRCIMNAARRGFSANDLSQVAQKCSQWNQDAAFLQGCHDYASAYQPEMSQWIPALSSPIFPFPRISKRCSSSTSSTSTGTSIRTGDTHEPEGRQVRRRVSAAM